MKIFRVTLGTQNITFGFPRLDIERVETGLKDGRVASKWAELLAAEIYCQSMAVPDAHGHDLITMGDSKTEVKCLTQHGVAFRRSKNTGVGRTCDSGAVLDFASAVESVIVVDVANTPIWDFIKITSGLIVRWHQEKIINANDGSISYSRFYAALGEKEILPWPQ